MARKHIKRENGYEGWDRKEYKYPKKVRPTFKIEKEVTAVPLRPYGGRLKKRQYKKLFVRSGQRWEHWEMQPHKVGDVWFDPCGGLAHRICRLVITWKHWRRYRAVDYVSVTKDDGNFFCGCSPPVKTRLHNNEINHEWLTNFKKFRELISGTRESTPEEAKECVKGSFWGVEQQQCMYNNVPEYKAVVDQWLNTDPVEGLLDSDGVLKTSAQDTPWGLHSGIPYPSEVGVEKFLEAVLESKKYWFEFKNKYLQQ